MTNTQILERANQLYSYYPLTADLFPGRYESFATALEQAEQEAEIHSHLKSVDGLLLSHYYLPPPHQEAAHKLGDSLALSLFAKKAKEKRIYFGGVAFMAQTAKILNPDKHVYMFNTEQMLNCSLVLGTDLIWISDWRKQNPDGIIVTYINSSPETKAISNCVVTSRNAGAKIAKAVKDNPNKRVLILPDQFLGLLMKERALKILKEKGVVIDPETIEIYDQRYDGQNASCYVHEDMGSDAMLVAAIENKDALIKGLVELLGHPECGCIKNCVAGIHKNNLPFTNDIFLSTEQMLQRARASKASKFIIATEVGMVYALRRAVPDKKFIPLSFGSHCKYMEENGFDLTKVVETIKYGRTEIIICDKCRKCLPGFPYRDNDENHIPKNIADAARIPCERMLTE